MAFIYVITNKINGKQYVGKTTDSIKNRWADHIKNTKRKRSEKRPLYDAMNKYGIDNFFIEELEQCSINVLSDREQYWIKKLNTYHDGYNATLGGDGSILYNYKELADKYIELQNQFETAAFFNCDVSIIRKACREYNIPIITSSEQNRKRFGKSVEMLDKNNNVLQIFESQSEAAKFLQENNYSNIADYTKLSYKIGEVCRGKRQTCCGYKWRYHL